MSTSGRCSFCGKPEDSVGRLIVGGGVQPRSELPPVAICDQCIELCTQILAQKPQEATSVRWQPLLYRGESFEWTSVPQPDGGRAVVVRRLGGTTSIGGVFPPQKIIAPSDIQDLIDLLYSRL